LGFWEGFEKQAEKSEKKKHKGKYDPLRHIGAASLGGLSGAGIGALFGKHPRSKAIGGALGAVVGSRAYRRSEGL